jgi:hypothetical protein
MIKILVVVLASFVAGLVLGVSIESKPAARLSSLVSAPIEKNCEIAQLNDTSSHADAIVSSERNEEKIDPLDELIILATAPEKLDANPFSQLVNRITVDADARAYVLRTLDSEPDPRKRAKLLSALSFLDTSDVVDKAVAYTAEIDSTRRIDGYNLLRTAQYNSPNARGILLDSLLREEDDAALATAISALVPESNPSAEDKASIISELDKLNQHASAEVRGEVVLAMSRWNPGSKTESLIQSALLSGDTQLQESALTALAENPIRNKEMKIALVSIVSDEKMDSASRWRALDTLGSYDLSEKESQEITSVRQLLPELVEN